jgi:hypothetical protein
MLCDIAIDDILLDALPAVQASPQPYSHHLDNSSTSADPTCVAGMRCGRSNCIHCAQSKTYRRSREAVLNLNTKPNLYRLVLPLEANGEALKPRLAHLYESFSRLRETKYWKTRIVGGIYNLHVDYNPALSHWNVHLDCILEASPVNQSDISNAWLQATGGSHVVNLQQVGPTELDRIKLSKYVLKPTFKGIVNEEDLMAEYMTATHRRRKCDRLGKWRNNRNVKTNWKKLPVVRHVYQTTENEGKITTQSHKGDQCKVKQRTATNGNGAIHSYPNSLPFLEICSGQTHDLLPTMKTMVESIVSSEDTKLVSESEGMVQEKVTILPLGPQGIGTDDPKWTKYEQEKLTSCSIAKPQKTPRKPCLEAMKWMDGC